MVTSVVHPLHHRGPTDVHLRRRVDVHGRVTAKGLVFCPLRSEWISVEACRSCAEGSHLPLPAHERRRLGLRALVRERVAAAMDDCALAVEGTTPVSVVARVLESEGEDGAVVVDAHDQPIGAVAWSDLRSEDADVPVQSVMSEPAVTLLEGATVADALSLIGGRGPARIPVLSRGRLVGILTPRGLLAWLTRRSAGASPLSLDEGAP